MRQLVKRKLLLITNKQINLPAGRQANNPINHPMSDKYFAKKINLRADEEMAAILHHHPITYIKQFCITAFLILLSFFLMFYFLSLGQIGAALFLAILATGIFYGLREFFIWYNNVFIITSDRIIDIDQKGFFHKTVSELGYDKINDISYSVHGLIQTIFKLGTIKIQAAGAALVLRNLKEPGKVNQLLVDLIKNQTGKKIEVKQAKNLNAEYKAQLTDDFLKQEELDKYDGYNLVELIEEFKDDFGELKLKKLLVDELDKYEGEKGKEDIANSDTQEEEEIIAGNFRGKKL